MDELDSNWRLREKSKDESFQHVIQTILWKDIFPFHSNKLKNKIPLAYATLIYTEFVDFTLLQIFLSTVFLFRSLVLSRV